MPLTISATKLMVWTQWVTRTRAECRGESRTFEYWIVSPGRYVDSAIASAETLTLDNAAVNGDRDWFDRDWLTEIGTAPLNEARRETRKQKLAKAVTGQIKY